MKTFTRLMVLLLLLCNGFFWSDVKAQSILDPNDPVITYNSSAPPAQPPYGQIGKWVRTVRVWFNTDSYKAYFYKSNAFRLKFPKSYNPTAVDGKKYPVLIFFHGLGELGSIYDNEYSLFHGGYDFQQAVDTGAFDGYVFVMQSVDGYWGPAQFTLIKEIMDYMAANNKVDPYRILVNGLSAGGAGTWDMTLAYPTYVAASLPISANCVCYQDTTTANKIKFKPMWNFQGGLDQSPDPYTSQQTRNYMLAAGANYRYTEYPNLGHDCWDAAWREPDFYPFLNRAYGANPWPLFGKTEFCPNDTINVTIGLTPGFDAYEWRKNGVVIPGATTNTIKVTQTGTYSARVLRGGIWSDTSHVPVVIKMKAATVTPTITIPPFTSNVIPALDTSHGVTLQVPNTYASYMWQQVGNSTVVGTSNSYYATTPGSYVVQVKELYGCTSNFTNPYTVVNANGTNKPDPVTNVTATTLSYTSIKLDWLRNPNPAYSETGYEIYQSTTSGGPYQLVALTAAGATTYTLTGLNPNSKYYYKIRAINNYAASAGSNEAGGATIADTQPPTAPTNLAVTGSTRNSVSLSWTAATDNVGVTGYDVYVNGQKVAGNIPASPTQFTAYNLSFGQTYNFAVKARDYAGNVSTFSNQVTAQPLLNGFNYKYFTFTGTWNNLPDFGTLVPVSRGVMTNINLAPTQPTNFAYLWEGYINIPVSGTYYFRTNSDAGSRLWLGGLNQTSSPYSYSGIPTVNNDGLRSAGSASATSLPLVLTAGVYPIAIAYYQQDGVYTMGASWQTPQTGANFVSIPDSAFANRPAVNGQAPARPTGVTATAVSYSRINLNWTSNSTNETGFEIWRSTSQMSGFATVGVAPARATSFVDSSMLSAGTTYYYKVRAIGQYGESTFSNDGPGVAYAYYEQTGLNALPNFNSLTPVRTGRTANIGLGLGERQYEFQYKFSGLITVPVAGTYTFYTTSDDGSNLYIDGFDSAHLVVGNDYVQAPTERSGTVTLTAGTHTIYVTYFQSFGGYYLSASYQGPTGSGITKQAIPAAVLGDQLPSATTLQLPTVPAAPTNLTASAISASAIKLSWTDSANNEDKEEVYRSANSNTNYVLVATLPARTVAYTDSSLYAGSQFYYKVRAVNAGGASAYSNEATATTGSIVPVITPIANMTMRYGTSKQVNVTATEKDSATITLQFTNLPSFAAFTSTGNGTGTLNFNPSLATNQGTYNITVTATNSRGSNSSTSFALVVNDNYPPQIQRPVSGITLNAKQTGAVSLAATDQDSTEVLRWSFTGLPAFATVATGTGGRNAQVNVAPGYSDAGVYPVQVKVDDGRGAIDTASFAITVNKVSPNKKIYVNFTNSTTAGAPWNNTSALPALNVAFPSLKDDGGNATAIGLKITSDWANMGYGDGTNTYGVNTGNNSGVYPDAVMSTAYFTNANPQSFNIYGLDTSSLYSYNVTVFGSRCCVNDDRTTIYTIGGTTVSYNAANNSQNTLTVSSVKAKPDGTIPVILQKGPNSLFGYINAMVIEVVYNDKTVPAKPRNIAAQLTGSQVSLTWFAAAYNATTYQVYRATSAPGPYSLLNPGVVNPTMQQYNDSSIASNNTYYYYVNAVNSNGVSPSSDTVSVNVPNVPPVFGNIPNVTVNAQQVKDVSITATTAPGNTITLTASGLPAFASFTDQRNGNGVLHLTPASGDVGNYTGIVFTATDNRGGSSTKTIAILVNAANQKNVYINFNDGSASQPAQAAPWNNMNQAPNAGISLSNLKDESGNNTGFGISLVEAWDGANNLGAVTGNNSGVFPDNVMQSFYYNGTAAVKHINLTALIPSNKYNLTFFGSRGSVTDNRITYYSVGNQTVSLNAAGNTSQTVQINGVTPDANGNIAVSIYKDAGAPYGYINAMVIQYPYDSTFYAPSAVKATGLSASAIRVDWASSYANTTSFEIWRSPSANGTYSLLATTAATVKTYTDAGLPSASSFFYKIRAVSNGRYSPYSLPAGGSTVGYTLDINFNDGSSNPPQPGNWNNTNTIMTAGFVLPNMIDQNGQNTGINMTLVKNFTGYNVYGTVTGNNSGVYPDNVMAGFFYVNYGDTARLKISGLNLTSIYNFRFFGSRQTGTGVSVLSSYQIGNQVVALDANNNTTTTVQISGVAPDSTGSVYISVYNTTFGRAYLNAMTIEGIPSANASTTPPLLVPSQILQGQRNYGTDNVVTGNTLGAYPNPFTTDVALEMNLAKPADRLYVDVIDISGRIMFRKQLANVPQGTSRQVLGANTSGWAPGVYLVRVEGLPEGGSKTIKLLKRR